MAESAATELLARARRRRRWSCAIESCAAGGSAAGIAVASAIAQQVGGAPSFRGLAALGVVCAAAMAATWWFERAKLSDRELALRIDRRLGRDGAWFSLWEARDSGRHSVWIDALEAREAAALPRNAVSTAVPLPSATWLAPPCLAAALLALAWERPGFLAPHDSPLAGSVGARGHGLAEEAGARAEPRAPAGATEAAARRDLSQARTDPKGRPAEEVPSEPAAGSPSVSAASGAPALPGAAEEGNSTLANRGAERTMVGSQRSDAAALGPAAAAEPLKGASDGAGTLTGRWWPERHDALVQGWRRALAARGGRD